MQSTLQLYSLSYKNTRTYLFATLFIIGNILLPQLFHLIPNGGCIWLPIYFFTLVGAYKYGWKVGILTAILSPVINSALFGMPASSAVAVIISKSVLLAVAAGWIASKFKKSTLALLTLAVLFYQIFGTFIEWGLTGDLSVGLQDFRIGMPGMLLQIFGGWFVINKLLRN